MNTSPFLQPRLPILTFFVFRSGIPLLIYFVSLSIVCEPGAVLFALMTSYPIIGLLHLGTGRRAIDQPFWLLALSMASVPAAALAGCLADLLVTNSLSLGSAFSRSLVVAGFQKNLEILLTVTNSCSLVVCFLLLWALSTTVKTYVAPPSYSPEQKRKVRLTRLILILVTLSLSMLFALSFLALNSLESSLKTWGWDALPNERNISFSHPALFQKSLSDFQDEDFRGEDKLSIYESVAHDLLARQFQATQVETLVLWRLTDLLQSTEPGDRRSALFVAAVLAHNRHWRLGCTERLTSYFRNYTLALLASPDSTPDDLRQLQALTQHLLIHDQGGRERQAVARLSRESQKLVLWDADFNISLPLLYYALDNQLFPPHEPPAPHQNPELEALEAVIMLRREQIESGQLPLSYPISAELGFYRRTSLNTAELVLRESDPTCRPRAVIRFGSEDETARQNDTSQTQP
jgi:hypothetical protein